MRRSINEHEWIPRSCCRRTLIKSLTKKKVRSSSARHPSLSITLHAGPTAPFVWRHSALGAAAVMPSSSGLNRAITQHALLRRAASHTILPVADRRTCHDTVRLSCRDWWRGGWAGLAGIQHGLCPAGRKNRNWLPFGSEAVVYSPGGLRPASRCASEQYLQRPDLWVTLLTVHAGHWGWHHTWYHGVEALQVLVCHATLVAHFIHKAVDKAHHRVRHVWTFGVFEATLCVVALCHAACDTAKQSKLFQHFCLNVTALPSNQQTNVVKYRSYKGV